VSACPTQSADDVRRHAPWSGDMPSARRTTPGGHSAYRGRVSPAEPGCPVSAASAASAPAARRPAGRVAAARRVATAAGVMAARVVSARGGLAARPGRPGRPPAAVAAAAAPGRPPRPARRTGPLLPAAGHDERDQSDADDRQTDTEDHGTVPLSNPRTGPPWAPVCSWVHGGCPHAPHAKAELRKF
jgi:hypothetical protein